MKNDSSPSQLLLSAEGVAELLQISERTLWRLRSAGKVPKPILLGGSVRWRASEITLWVQAGCPPLTEWEARQ